jgi:hypothetical protein
MLAAEFSLFPSQVSIHMANLAGIRIPGPVPVKLLLEMVWTSTLRRSALIGVLNSRLQSVQDRSNGGRTEPLGDPEIRSFGRVFFSTVRVRVQWEQRCHSMQACCCTGFGVPFSVQAVMAGSEQDR